MTPDIRAVTDTALALLADLVAHDSVSSNSNLPIIDYIERYLSSHGIWHTRAPAPEGPKSNLIARIGPELPDGVVLSGHTDVVPVGDEDAWTHPPFAAEIAGGELFGRGAVDMKGGVACFVAAIARHIEKHGLPKGSVSFLITGDEEGPAVNGTIKLLQWAAERGERWDACLVGEPTNPNTLGEMIKIGRRGSLSGKLIIKGILDVEDAEEAAKTGAQALVVSNHGGRQLDGAPSSIEVLPEIAEAIGDRMEIMFDGGIRTGQDVMRALALGAKSCMIGRAYIYGLGAGGQPGVTTALDLIGKELSTTMGLCGINRIDEIDRHVLTDHLQTNAVSSLRN